MTKEYKLCYCTIPAHIENCETCFGFGVLEESTNTGRKAGSPRYGGEATKGIRTGKVCPECHSGDVWFDVNTDFEDEI